MSSQTKRLACASLNDVQQYSYLWRKTSLNREISEERSCFALSRTSKSELLIVNGLSQSTVTDVHHDWHVDRSFIKVEEFMQKQMRRPFIMKLLKREEIQRDIKALNEDLILALQLFQVCSCSMNDLFL